MYEHVQFKYNVCSLFLVYCLGNLFLDLLGEGQKVAFLLADPAGIVWSGRRRSSIASAATAGSSSPLGALLMLTWLGIGAGVIEFGVEVNDGLAAARHLECSSLLLCNMTIVFFDSDGRGASSADATQGLGAIGAGGGHVDLAHSG